MLLLWNDGIAYWKVGLGYALIGTGVGFTAIAAAPNGQQISDSTENQLTKSFAGAEEIAGQYPQYANQIVAAAKTSFLDGADWAYGSIVAILLGAALVVLRFPKKEEEQHLLARYHEQDTAGRTGSASNAVSPAACSRRADELVRHWVE
jgi:hypothetical protein